MPGVVKFSGDFFFPEKTFFFNLEGWDAMGGKGVDLCIRKG